MVWCAMVCHDEWESVRLYAIVWYSNDIVWDSMLCYEISILCYAMLYVVKDLFDPTVHSFLKVPFAQN